MQENTSRWLRLRPRQISPGSATIWHVCERSSCNEGNPHALTDVRGILAAVSLDILASAWAGWRAGIHSAARQKAATASALSHWQNSLLAKAWAAWAARVQGRARLQSMLMSVARRFSQPLLAAAFEEWALYVEERKIAQACPSLALPT